MLATTPVSILLTVFTNGLLLTGLLLTSIPPGGELLDLLVELLSVVFDILLFTGRFTTTLLAPVNAVVLLIPDVVVVLLVPAVVVALLGGMFPW